MALAGPAERRALGERCPGSRARELLSLAISWPTSLELRGEWYNTQVTNGVVDQSPANLIDLSPGLREPSNSVLVSFSLRIQSHMSTVVTS